MSDRRLSSLHVIAKHDAQDQKLVRVGPGEYDSGHWSATEAFAAQAVGAVLHLHERQADASWRAGPITAWRPSEHLPGRVVFRFKVDPSLQRKQLEGWGQEQARIWD